ncbi:DUF2867 domain-containing protein, partial [Streptomyces sp. 12297]
MRLPKTAHTSLPWRIHEIAPDFRLDDVWALPTPGGPDDLARLVEQMSTGATDGRGAHASAVVPRVLFAIRWKLGRLLGWDRPDGGLGTRVRTLRDRLPEDLRDGPRGPDLQAVPFTSLYLTHDEWACETANRTVHAIMHVGWVADGAGGHRGQIAVLVKPNGLLGVAYMAAIKPFRYWCVYPVMLRAIGRAWQQRAAAQAGPPRPTPAPD